MRYASQVRARLERTAEVPRELADALVAMKESGVPDRRLALAILRRSLEADPGILACWTVWEPNAFDDLDARYRNAAGYDATGRFAPYYSRNGGSIELSPRLDYGTEGTGDYYLIPKESSRETLLEPYGYSATGRPEDSRLVTSSPSRSSSTAASRAQPAWISPFRASRTS